MDEHVERENLKDAFEFVTNDCTCPMHIAAEIYQILDCVPGADVVKVRHGRWVSPHWRNSDFACNCSDCGGEAMHREYRWHERGIYPICPNCGARMDKED